MSETPVSLADARAERKWESSKNPGDFDPIDALEGMIRDIRKGDLAPTHIVIGYGEEPDERGVANCGYVQCGAYNRFETIGMLERVKTIMLDD